MPDNQPDEQELLRKLRATISLLTEEILFQASPPLSLRRHYAQVYSQYGEDGMIAEIFRRIGAGNRTFVEFGVGNGQENNTRLLLELGWSGFWFEGSSARAAKIGHNFSRHIEEGHLKIEIGSLNKSNVNDALRRAGVPPVVDFLSVDLDHNTSHIWNACELRARAACVEYNASYPPSVDWEAPYDPAATWDRTNRFGASLMALDRIGRSKEMALVGCSINGVNAFFVANSEKPEQNFHAPFDALTHYERPRRELTRHSGHRPAQPEH